MKRLTKSENAYKNYRVTGDTMTKSYERSHSVAGLNKNEIFLKAKALEKHPVIKRAIETSDGTLAPSAITKEQAVDRLSAMALTKITDIIDFKNSKIGVDEDGNDIYQAHWTIKDADCINDYAAVAIKSVSSTRSSIKIEMHNQIDAIGRLTTILGWDSPKKLDHTSSDLTMSPAGMSRTDRESKIKELIEKIGK